MLPNHFDTVEAVSAAHPHLVATNNSLAVNELYQRVVWALHERDSNWGWLSKSDSENHQIVDGVRVALDAAAYKGSDVVIDFIGSAGDGPGTGSLSWGEKPRRPSNLWLQPKPFPGGSAPPPSTGYVSRTEFLAAIEAVRSDVAEAKAEAHGAWNTADDARGMAARCRADLGRLRAKGSFRLTFARDQVIDVPVRLPE